jgi:hypothetical protein
MTGAERDAKKDNTSSENRTMFNLSVDLLQQMGAVASSVATNKTPWEPYDRDDNLADVVDLMSRFLDFAGPKRFLFFVRAGRDGYNNCEKTKYEWKLYMAGIRTSFAEFGRDWRLTSDGRRIVMEIPNVSDTHPQGAPKAGRILMPDFSLP